MASSCEPNGIGKYALINMRRVRALSEEANIKAAHLIADLEALGVIDAGVKGADDEFFVIKLKDKNAEPALMAYANAADDDDKEWALQVLAMAARAKFHPGKKQPD